MSHTTEKWTGWHKSYRINTSYKFANTFGNSGEPEEHTVLTWEEGSRDPLWDQTRHELVLWKPTCSDKKKDQH